MLVRSSAGGLFSCYLVSQEDYVPELWEIGLDPAVQGVPFKKKPSVRTYLMSCSMYNCTYSLSLAALAFDFTYRHGEAL